MSFFTLVAEAFTKDGKRLNGNTHKIEASSQRDAVEIAKGRQNNTVGTARVEVKVIRVSDKN